VGGEVSMEFGCHLPIIGRAATRENVVGFAQRMETLGYESVWVRDHVVLPWKSESRYPYTHISPSGQYPVAPSENLLEPLTTLALVAGVTERIRLGTTVLVLPHRHPVLAAKIVATLDHLSNGRVILGVGVGWLREEITLFGVPYGRRGDWSDEAIRVMRTCWSEAKAAHHGKFFHFDELGCFPQPVRKAVPIWIGGNSARAIRRAAELGDGWHPAFGSMAKLRDGREQLGAECARVGRRLEDVTITLRAVLSVRREPSSPRQPLQGTPEEIVSDLKQYRALGVQTVVLQSPGEDLETTVRLYETFARDIRPFV